MNNIADRLADHARHRSDRAAIIDGARTVRFGEPERLVRRAASVLREAGVKQGDIVGLCLADTADHLILHYAVARLGAAILPMDVRWTGQEKANIAHHFRPRLAVVEARGYLYLAGRAKHMIIRGGVNIFPEEIEQVLIEHPAVRDAVVVAWPSPARGEEVAAFVVAGSKVGEAELKEHCAAVLAPYKVPRAGRAGDGQRASLHAIPGSASLHAIPWVRFATRYPWVRFATPCRGQEHRRALPRRSP